MWRAAAGAVLAATALGAPGCAGGVTPLPAKAVDTIVSAVVEWIEDETGVELDKGDVKLEALGTRRDGSGGAHIADFRLTVTYRKTTFTTTPKDVPCSAEGVPTDEGTRRVREAVQEIKAHIRATR